MCWHSWREFQLKNKDSYNGTYRICRKCGKSQRLHSGYDDYRWETISEINKLYGFLSLHFLNAEGEYYEKKTIEEFEVRRVGEALGDE